MTLVLAVLLEENGSALGRVIADIPHDAAAVFIYIFLVISLYLIWRGSRTRT